MRTGQFCTSGVAYVLSIAATVPICALLGASRAYASGDIRIVDESYHAWGSASDYTYRTTLSYDVTRTTPPAYGDITHNVSALDFFVDTGGEVFHVESRATRYESSGDVVFRAEQQTRDLTYVAGGCISNSVAASLTVDFSPHALGGPLHIDASREVSGGFWAYGWAEAKLTDVTAGQSWTILGDNGRGYYWNWGESGPPPTEVTMSIPLQETHTYRLEAEAFAPEGDPSSITVTFRGVTIATDKPKGWCFVQISDTHMGPEDARKNLCAVLRAAIRDEKPAFIVNTGDVADSGCTMVASTGGQGCPSFYDDYAEIIKRHATDAGVQVYNISGNHDQSRFATLVPCGNFPSCFCDSCGNGDNVFYSARKEFSRGNPPMLFLALDTTQKTAGTSCEGVLTEDDILWLKQRDKQPAKIILTHHPAVAKSSDADPRCPGDIQHITVGQDEFLSYCEDKSNNVCLVLSGHTHKSHAYDRNLGTPGKYIQTGSVGNTKGAYPVYRRINVLGGVAKDGWVRAVNPATEACIDCALHSPGTVHVYDSQGRHTGYDPIADSEHGIPGSLYFKHYIADGEDGPVELPEEVMIFDPCDDYRFEVVGTESGGYGLSISSEGTDHPGVFEASDIPAMPGSVHEYTVDWDALSHGEQGVTLHIDRDGDGQVESTILSDSVLTGDELALNAADFDGNGFIDHGDLKVLTDHWLARGCATANGCDGTDLSHDGRVNIADLARFAEVWGRGMPPGPASEPTPSDGLSKVDPNVVLTWLPGQGATLHEIYFGTSESEVRDANTASTTFVCAQTGASWRPGRLDSGVIWYWRVDERSKFGVTKGHVWKFTTLPDVVLTAHWTFDDGDGIVAQDSVGGHEGTVQGAKWLEGRIAGALSFDGLNDYVDCGSDPALIPGQTTIAFWVSMEGRTSYQYLLGRISDVTLAQECMFSTGDEGKLEFAFGLDAWKRVVVRSLNALPVGRWVHVAATRDGATASLYLDGQLQDSAPYSLVPPGEEQPLRIGSVGTTEGAGFFKGRIDDVRIYDKVLSAEEVLKLYQEETP